MDYEKEYKQLHKFIGDLYPHMSEYCKEKVEGFFPELRKSEDEKVKQAIVHILYENYTDTAVIEGVEVSEIITWLEKQSEEVSMAIMDETQGKQKKPAIIQWKGDNLKDVIDFTGVKRFHYSLEELEKYIKKYNNIFKIYNTDGSQLEIPVGAWIVKTPDGYNIASSYENAVEYIDWLEKQDKKTIPLEDIIHNVWELGNLWKELTNGVCTTEYGRQIDYIVKHWKEGEHYIKSVEKLCGQKPINKMEPKFKVGDWIYCKGFHPALILNIVGDKYEIEFTDNGTKGFHRIDLMDRHYHPWTIEDAKNGDIVVNKTDGSIGIFQSMGHHPDGGSYNDPSYCFLHCRYDDGFFYADFENGNMFDSEDLIPATTGQCNLLFQRMTEAGYEWDAQNKVLRKQGKQGKQESANKVEPKFKVGDWCIDNEDGTIFQIVQVLDSTYTYKTNEGKEYSCSHFALEIDAKLWTIEDAKEGDVLYSHSSNLIWIYKDKTTYHTSMILDYAKYNCISMDCDIVIPLDAYPATKEQRDLLFQKMAGAGYKWDAGKKELVKIS